MYHRSVFGLTEHLDAPSKHGDPLEVLEATVDIEHFRGSLVGGWTRDRKGNPNEAIDHRSRRHHNRG